MIAITLALFDGLGCVDKSMRGGKLFLFDAVSPMTSLRGLDVAAMDLLLTFDNNALSSKSCSHNITLSLAVYTLLNNSFMSGACPGLSRAGND